MQCFRNKIWQVTFNIAGSDFLITPSRQTVVARTKASAIKKVLERKLYPGTFDLIEIVEFEKSHAVRKSNNILKLIKK